jgi:ubiquinone/menaquinone biosynthesis C-methylase UbiE
MTPAEAYEQLLVPSIFGPWARAVLRAHPPARGTAVLDVACGTGIGARVAAGLVGPSGRVVGVDADDGMLAVARKTGGGAEDAPIEWRHGNAVDLPFAAGTFDRVLCFEGLQFFPDRVAGLREARRMLRPGGALVATVWGPLAQNPGYEAIADALAHFVSAEAARLPPFTLPDADAVRALLEAAGFRDASVMAESLTFTAPSAEALVDWVAAGGPTIRHNLALLAAERRREFGERVAARLAPYRTGVGLSLPSVRHVIVAG